LEVNGSIGPDQNGVYDLDRRAENSEICISPDRQLRRNITISNSSPEISFIETDNSNYQYNITTDDATFAVVNATTGLTGLSIDANAMSILPEDQELQDVQLLSCWYFSCAGTITGTGLTATSFTSAGVVTNNASAFFHQVHN